MLKEDSLDIDLEREARPLKVDIEEIANIFHNTDEPLKQFQGVANQFGETERIVRRRQEFSNDEHLHKLIQEADSEAEKWIKQNT